MNSEFQTFLELLSKAETNNQFRNLGYYAKHLYDGMTAMINIKENEMELAKMPNTILSAHTEIRKGELALSKAKCIEAKEFITSPLYK